MRKNFFLCQKCLEEIFKNQAFSSIELNKVLVGIEDRDKRFVTKVVYGVLENNVKIEQIIFQFAQKVKPVSVFVSMKIAVFCFLNMSLEKAIVVNECVNLVKKKSQTVAGFVNKTLKNISSAIEQNTISRPSEKKEALAFEQSLPLWFVGKILKQYGDDVGQDILTYKDKNYFTHIRSADKTCTKQMLRKAIEVKGMTFEETVFGFNIKGDSKLLPSNLFTVQSMASIAVCHAVSPKDDQKILDVCGAPGGKSVLMSQMANVEVVCCDLHPHRVTLIEKYAKKMQTSVSALVRDATKKEEKFVNRFDSVLCDVPCSGFGVVSSKPDILLFKTKEDILSLQKLQKEILQNCSQYVKVGGHLVYSTCTIFKEENQDVVNDFLKKNQNFEAVKIDLPFEDTETKEGFVQLLPHKHKTSGFFIAKLVRKS